MWKLATGRHEDFLKKEKGQSISIVKPNPTRAAHHYSSSLVHAFLLSDSNLEFAYQAYHPLQAVVDLYQDCLEHAKLPHRFPLLRMGRLFQPGRSISTASY